ncbi:hypothetical protein [Paenibacillus abyssi]|uniref:HTH araC/xylS-type domain-containing protein n=1 Tax=Paenibacillus abyssi TaxID=1340531 RepID=A0A917LEK8_9BACL|nr:hypothetical protein [Paenibacillus abyssi]GGG15854.1 hypothetical protein GCM10010916_35990 [Paenibacillus abyssi]
MNVTGAWPLPMFAVGERRKIGEILKQVEKFRSHTGQTLNDYLTAFRMEKAKMLLL